MSPPELSSTPEEFTVKGRMAGKRIDAYLTHRYPTFSRSVIQKVIDASAVEVNGVPVKASYKVRVDDLIRVRLPELVPDVVVAENIPIRIVYEDPYFAVVDKPAGLVTHPAKGHWSGTLVNALQFHFDSLSTSAGEHRPGIVHRLDRDTSGLLIVAKDDRAHQHLAKQFESRTIKKEYLALVGGVPGRDSDYIERTIGPHPTNREKMAIRTPEEGGKPAVTYYEVVERFRAHALVRCRPETGRTHQIRIHLAHVGHPVLADKAYSGRDRFALADLLGPDGPDADRALLTRQALHAHALAFAHPIGGEAIALTAPLHEDMATALAALREHGGLPPDAAGASGRKRAPRRS